MIASPNWPVFWTCYPSSSAGFAVTGAREQFFSIIAWLSTHRVKLAGWCGCQAVPAVRHRCLTAGRVGSGSTPVSSHSQNRRTGGWLNPKLPLVASVTSGPSSQLMIVTFGSGTTSWSQLRNGIKWMKGNLKPCSYFHEEKKKVIEVRKHTGDAWAPALGPSLRSVCTFACLRMSSELTVHCSIIPLDSFSDTRWEQLLAGRHVEDSLVEPPNQGCQNQRTY